MPDFLSLSWRLTAELANRYRYRYRSCICILYVLRIRTRARMFLLSGTVTDIKAHSPAYSTYVCKYICICFKCFAFDLFSSLIKNAFRNFHFVSLPSPAPRARCGSDALSDKRNMLIKSKAESKAIPSYPDRQFSRSLAPSTPPLETTLRIWSRIRANKIIS